MANIHATFADKNAAREKALPLCREALRNSANAIRAVHREEFGRAEELIAGARSLIDEAREALKDHPDTYHAGFVHDAHKEYVEACTTLAVTAGRPLPTPAQLSASPSTSLHRTRPPGGRKSIP